MAFIRVRFSPGFPLRGGFLAEQLHPLGALREYNTARAKKQFPEVLCVF
jgi:hypothetical protein